jgi:hypothetical protein
VWRYKVELLLIKEELRVLCRKTNQTMQMQLGLPRTLGGIEGLSSEINTFQ